MIRNLVALLLIVPMLPTPALANTYRSQNSAVDRRIERQQQELDYLSRLQQEKDNEERIRIMREELAEDNKQQQINPLATILGLAVVGGLVYGAVKENERDVNVYHYNDGYRRHRRGHYRYNYRY